MKELQGLPESGTGCLCEAPPHPDLPTEVKLSDLFRGHTPPLPPRVAAMTSNDWSSGWADEDDDLQKALRASLMEAEAVGGGGSMVAIDCDNQLPHEVSTKFSQVVTTFERQRRILWYNVEEALTAAEEHFEHMHTQAFLTQMVKEIVQICVGDCSWAEITEDLSTKEDFRKNFVNILMMCCRLSINCIRFPPAPRAPLQLWLHMQ